MEFQTSKMIAQLIQVQRNTTVAQILIRMASSIEMISVLRLRVLKNSKDVQIVMVMESLTMKMSVQTLREL